MRNKKIISIFIVLFIMLFTFGVKADEWQNSYITIQKGENSGNLYNLMPTEVKEGDYIRVKLVLKNASGWKVSSILSSISYDKNVFELVETSSKYYTVLNTNVESAYVGITNGLYVSCTMNGQTINSGNVELLELKFKVKSNVKDGVYNIIQQYSDFGVSISSNDGYYESYASYSILKYQVGEPKIISDYAKDNISSNTYIIGNYMFTREGSDEYDGILTTDYIMLASKSIESNDKKDMIVYAKNARGNWINAITNQSVTPPSEFNIKYVDMKSNYQENGIYSDNGDKTILRFVQLNDSEVLVTIENEKERVHGIATINNRVATLTIDGVAYKVTISDNSASITTSDSGIGNKTLQKRANFTIADYYNHVYYDGGVNESNNFLHYINSVQTGKYTYGNYELYFLRTDDTYAKICLREKGKTNCIFNGFSYVMAEGDKDTYVFENDNKKYGFKWSENQLEIKCIGTCNSSYNGLYQKNSTLSFEDTFHVWEKNEASYYVEFRAMNELVSGDFVPKNTKLNTSDEFEWIIENGYTIQGYRFVEWRVNNVKYDFNTAITGPVTINAKFDTNIPTPVITSVEGYNYYDRGIIINNYTDYCSGSCTGSETDTYFVDGYEVYEKNGTSYTKIATVNGMTSYNYTAEPNTNKTYAVRAFIGTGSNKLYSDYSNEVTVNIIPAPVISQTITGPGGEYGSWPQPLVFELIGSGELTEAFSFELNANSSTYMICNPSDPSDCDITIDGYDVFEKNGETLTDVADLGASGSTNIDIPIGTSKTFVAKPYTNNQANEKIYGPESNEITIDLTNPTYTFETVELASNSNKVGVKAYINNYEIAVYGIKIGGTVYDGSEDMRYYVTMNKEDIEDVNSVILGVEQASQLDPNTFIVEKTASRKS